jgi:apolipoprotein N-acyltransferase
MKGWALFLTLLSAVLLPMALPNDLNTLGNPLLGAVCLAPLFMAYILSPSFGFSAVLGMIFGGLSTFLVHYWLLFFNEFSIWTISGVVVGYIGYHALLGPILHGLTREQRLYRFFLLSAAWALYEYLKSSGFLGFPWGLAAHPFNTVLPLIQFIDITGIWGLSLLAAFVNALVAELLLGFFRGYRNPLWLRIHLTYFVSFLLAAALAYGLYTMNRSIPYKKSMRMLLVQHNENPWVRGKADEAIAAAQTLSLQGLEGVEADLVIWSETAVKHFIREETFDLTVSRLPDRWPLGDFIRETDTHFLLGAPFQPAGETGFLNAALLVSPDAKLIDFYGKRHLVPMSETIPLWHWGLVRNFFENVIGISQGWTPGNKFTVFSVPLADGGAATFGVPICFEDSFGSISREFIRRGADFLVNLTNVSWSQRKSAEYQMFVASRFRSIENRRVLVRATNGGVTAVVGPTGEIIEKLPLFESASLFAVVPIYRDNALTPYSRWGDWLPYVLAVVLLAALLNRLRRRFISSSGELYLLNLRLKA